MLTITYKNKEGEDRTIAWDYEDELWFDIIQLEQQEDYDYYN